MDLGSCRVLVFGAGKSGIGAARLLLSVPAASVVLYDGNAELDAAKLECAILAAPQSKPGTVGHAGTRSVSSVSDGAVSESSTDACDSAARENDVSAGSRLQIELGEFPQELTGKIDLAVLSPGVPTDLPVVNALRESGVRIWGEVELAWECGRGDVLAITGTNGKTTTTSLLGEIMERFVRESAEGLNDQVFVVGNIGNPYTDAAPLMTDRSITVAEISSFQLETIEGFAPRVSAILNITPDHLNRHHTMEEYIRVKERIAENQGAEDTCVLNYEDEILRAFGETLKTNVIYFSSLHKLEKGMYLDGENICYCDGEKETVICTTGELNILGRHNHENVMAAVAMAIAFGVPIPVIRKTVCAFQAVEHRIEYVTEKKGVVYYNDSKGTNPDAAIKGIQAMDRPTWLIGGGYDKNSSYEEWIQAFDGKVKCLVLIGQTREKIAETAMKCGFENCVLKDSLEEAVAYCAEHAESGDAVLLSPACASWGMFPNYEVRGRRFKELARAL